LVTFATKKPEINLKMCFLRDNHNFFARKCSENGAIKENCVTFFELKFIKNRKCDRFSCRRQAKEDRPEQIKNPVPDGEGGG